MTFFFKNFLVNCSINDLTERFKDVGLVRDIFIPNRKGTNGIRYGFVRFGSGIDISRVELLLNKMWFGTYKLRANLSRFERGSFRQVLRVEKTIPKHNFGQCAQRKENTTYADGLGGSYKPMTKGLGGSINQKEAQRHSSPNKSVGFYFSPDEEDKAFLRNCFTGCLREE